MRAIEAGFTAHGLTTHLTDARAGLDLTVVLSPNRKARARNLDRRGRVRRAALLESPGSSPAEVAATALRALAAVTSTPAVLSSSSLHAPQDQSEPAHNPSQAQRPAA